MLLQFKKKEIAQTIEQFYLCKYGEEYVIQFFIIKYCFEPGTPQGNRITQVYRYYSIQSNVLKITVAI